MIINTEIVDAYLNGEDINLYASMFIYKQGDKNIFQETKKDKVAIVSNIKDEIINHVKDFVPTNKKIWDTLFKDWPNELDDIVLDLVVGCKEPNDAFVLKDLNGRYHMVFDLLCWEKYVGKISLSKLSQNLLTHELFHVLIGKCYTDIEESEQFGNYRDKLDAITFNEGFAHLVSYNQQEIDSVEWEKLEDIYIQSTNKMKLALMEKNPQSQEQYIYEANFGNYYDKYACMSAMIYLAKEWQLGGYARLKELFDQGYHGFARKCI